MAQLAAFDIVSDFDQQELRNALDQALREIQTRYDLKDTKTTIDHGENDLTINSASEMSLQQVRDLLESKFVRRNLSLKILDYQKEEPASGGRVRQVVKLRRGIPDDLARQITKKIRDEHKKVTPQVQGDAVRVSGTKRDELQNAIALVKKAITDFPLQYQNFRD